MAKDNKIGDVLRADRIEGRQQYLDRDVDDWQWLFDVYLKPEVLQQANSNPNMTPGFLFSRENITAAILLPDETCAQEVWVTSANPVLYNSHFRLVYRDYPEPD